MNELFLFVRPPRPLWPFNGPGSAFWPPLAFASLAAALRESCPDLRVAILDAPALEMGWKTLTAEIRRLQPAYIGIGEEAVSCVEGLRVARLAREAGAKVVAGGCFFGHVGRQALATGLIDIVVQGEGEQTIVDLIPGLRSGLPADFRRIPGVWFRDGEETVFTGFRHPMPDLDRLPMPAYDLLPVERYGRTSHNHPGLAAVELGRGCPHACEFCVLWRQMGEFVSSRTLPYYRAKSPERLLEEVRLLMDRYGRRYFGWVDPCFNASPEVPGRMGELLLKEDRRVQQSAWTRADYLIRDAASGALEQYVAAGVNQVFVGVDRIDPEELRALRKGNRGGESAEALRILAQRFPQVFTVGSFIYGLPGETPASVRALLRGAYSLPLDMHLFIPLTPLPGTPYWRDELWDPTGEAFRHHDFLPKTNGDRTQNRLTMALFAAMTTTWPAQRLRRFFGGPFSRHRRRRSISLRHTARSIPFVASGMARGAFGSRNGGMRFPRWYDS